MRLQSFRLHGISNRKFWLNGKSPELHVHKQFRKCRAAASTANAIVNFIPVDHTKPSSIDLTILLTVGCDMFISEDVASGFPILSKVTNSGIAGDAIE